FPPTSPPFPYTTLFRSHSLDGPPQPVWRAHPSRRRFLQLVSTGVWPLLRLQLSTACSPYPNAEKLVIASSSSWPAYWVCLRAVRSEEHTSELQSRFDLV